MLIPAESSPENVIPAEVPVASAANSNLAFDVLYFKIWFAEGESMLNISMIAFTLSMFCFASERKSLGESDPESQFAVDAFVPAGQVAIVLISFLYIYLNCVGLYNPIIVATGQYCHSIT